jgi:TonB family protein
MYQVMGSGIVLAAISAAVAFQSATPTAQVPLEPSGPWTVNYADSMCVLSRQYGAGGHQVILGFRPGPMSDILRIALMFPNKSQKRSSGTATLVVDQSSAVKALFERGPSNTKAMQMILVDTLRSELGAFDAARAIRVAAPDYDVTFKLPNFAAATKALDACEKDLMVDWGMDPAVLASIKTMPRGSAYALFSADDYPVEAVANGQEGIVGMRFLVGKNGRVSDCRIVESSGYKALDDQSCRIVETRARFDPALTQAGEPVASLSFTRIRWELPE